MQSGYLRAATDAGTVSSFLALNRIDNTTSQLELQQRCRHLRVPREVERSHRKPRVSRHEREP